MTRKINANLSQQAFCCRNATASWVIIYDKACSCCSCQKALVLKVKKVRMWALKLDWSLSLLCLLSPENCTNLCPCSVRYATGCWARRTAPDLVPHHATNMIVCSWQGQLLQAAAKPWLVVM